ncbi:MAG TPA: iron-containing redox enzyme family protein [Gemmatimonadales bacterium]|nr:iron-containing redox enzyme family protein [Gemmatimonadales bacterium]
MRLTIRLASARVQDLSWSFWNHPRLSEIFPDYLHTLYPSMRATVPLLELAAERARALEETDPVAAALVPYFIQHAREELHHDDWLLEDMELLGLDSGAAKSAPGPPDIAAMIGSQYYWLHYAHPVALLGCFAVLEGSPPEVEMLDRVAERTGLPPAALRTLYKHAQLDPHHRDDLDELLDSLPLTPEHSALLGISALTTVDQLGGILERLVGAAVPAEV